MGESEFYERLGENIRSARTRRGISAEHLAIKLECQGVNISGRGIRNYENGTRKPSIDIIVKIAVCLDCSVQTLIDGLDPRMGKTEEIVELSVLTPEEHSIFRRMASEWDGDRHALIIFNALYMALPMKYRREAPLSLLIQMDKAISDGAVSKDDLPKGVAYMEEKWRSLYR